MASLWRSVWVLAALLGCAFLGVGTSALSVVTAESVDADYRPVRFDPDSAPASARVAVSSEQVSCQTDWIWEYPNGQVRFDGSHVGPIHLKYCITEWEFFLPTGYWVFDGSFSVPARAGLGPHEVEIWACPQPECGSPLFVLTFEVTAAIPSGPILQPSPTAPVVECADADRIIAGRDPSGRNELAIVLAHGWTGDDKGLIQVEGRLAQRQSGALYILDWRSRAARDESGWIIPETGNAQTLGDCLGRELKSFKQVHLIGHSLGSWVIDSAADQLTKAGVQTHVTFLDAFVPSGRAGELGDNASFAEHFVSRPAGGLPYTNDILPEAHNYDVTGEIQGWDEHGWPVEWYADSHSPGLRQSWEFGSSPAAAGDGKVTCLGTHCPSGQINHEQVQVPMGAATVADVRGSVTANAQEVTFVTSSPASAVIVLPAAANWFEVDLSSSLHGSGKGWLELRLGDGAPTRIEFGLGGFEGAVIVALPQVRKSHRLHVLLDTDGTAQARATISRIVAPPGTELNPAPPSGTPPPNSPSATPATTSPTRQSAPLPPNTGNSTAPTGGDPGHGVVLSVLVLTVGLTLIVGVRVVRYRR